MLRDHSYVWITKALICSSKSKSISDLGEDTDGGNQQTHQQRHRSRDGIGDVGIEASGNRSRQEREGGKGSYRDTSVQEIPIRPVVLMVVPSVNARGGLGGLGGLGLGPVGNAGHSGIPQSISSHQTGIQGVVMYMAIREARKDTEEAKDEEHGTSKHFLKHSAVSVVGCQGC